MNSQATYQQMVDQARQLEKSCCWRTASEWYKAATAKAPASLERVYCGAKADEMLRLVGMGR